MCHNMDANTGQANPAQTQTQEIILPLEGGGVLSIYIDYIVASYPSWANCCCCCCINPSVWISRRSIGLENEAFNILHYYFIKYIYYIFKIVKI